MNRARFNALPEEEQVAAVVPHDLFVARSWQEVNEAVH